MHASMKIRLSMCEHEYAYSQTHASDWPDVKFWTAADGDVESNIPIFT